MKPEEALHRTVAEYLRWVKPAALWFHAPNGARRSKAQSGILKAMGMLAGVPDLIFVCHGGTVKFIELKAPGKYLSPEQKAFKDMVTSMGASFALCRSVDDVAEALQSWGLVATKRAVGPCTGVRRAS